MKHKHTTLVLGASLRPERYSNMAIQRLRAKGQEVVAIGLRAGTVVDVPIHTTPIPFEGIDTVTLYLNPKRQVAYYDYLLQLAPRRVIFNPGTENSDFYERLAAVGIQVEVACTLVLLSTNQY